LAKLARAFGGSQATAFMASTIDAGVAAPVRNRIMASAPV
jgi:hypothetical protein